MVTTTTKILTNVTYKQETGTLTLNDKMFHFQANEPSKTSVKCSWARVEKRQLSPPSAAQHMIKLLLVSGKTAVFTVKDRATLEELRNDCQSRMEDSKFIDDATPSSNAFRQSQRDNESKMFDNSRKSTTTRVWEDEPVKERAQQSTSKENVLVCHLPPVIGLGSLFNLVVPLPGYHCCQ
jgi:TFIIH p62 subunit, N-terminal domain